AAIRRTVQALAANPPDAGGRRCGADVAAGAAVIGIRVERGANAIAAYGPLDALIVAAAVDARDDFGGTGLRTGVAAGSTVVNVVGEVGAVAAATGLPAAAADVAAAGTAEALGLPIARLAGRQACVLLPPVSALTQGLTRVLPRGGLPL